VAVPSGKTGDVSWSNLKIGDLLVGNAGSINSGVLIHPAVGVGVLVSVGVLEISGEGRCDDVIVGAAISVWACGEDGGAQDERKLNKRITNRMNRYFTGFRILSLFLCGLRQYFAQ
jgi:hypothetical protein